MSKFKFAIVAGDHRNTRLATILEKENSLVATYGLELADSPLPCRSLQEFSDALDEADAIIAPIPFSNDRLTLNAPLHQGRIYIHELFKTVERGKIIIGGRFDKSMQENAEVFGVRLIDIMDREEMRVANAIPTAEGAIQIAMEEMPITLHASNALVLGYGRIGKVMAQKLNGMGANVYVAARKKSDFVWIRTMGYKAVSYDEIKQIAGIFDVVFNTVPVTLMTEEVLGNFQKDCLLIDLASKPGGIDFDVAKNIGLKTIWALSLPGRVAPDSAAKYVKDTAINILEEIGGSYGTI